MRSIANNVANAGIGVDIGVNGLDKLIKTNSILQEIKDTAQKIKNMTAEFTVHIHGNQELEQIFQRINKIHHDFTSNVNVHTSGMNNLDQLQNRLNSLKQSHNKLNIDTSSLNKAQHQLNELRHSMQMDVHTNGTRGIDELNDKIRQTSESMRNMSDTSHQSFDRVGGSASHTEAIINSIRDNARNLQRTFNSAGNSISNSVDKIGENASKARDKTLSLSSAGNKIKGVFAGTALGNAISNTFSTIRSGAESAVKSGYELAQSGNEAREAWSHIGLNQNNANAMVEQMDQLRDKAGMSEQSIQQLQRSLYTVTGSAGRARSLTNEISAFGEASGEDERQISMMSRTLPRMLSTSKVRAQMFNRTFRQSPQFVNALAKASGRSGKSFRDLVNSGKMTSQQLQEYMSKAAKYSGNAWSEYAHTFRGQMQMIKGSWNEAKENFAKPFVNNLTKAIDQTNKSGGGLLKVQRSVGKLSTELGRRVGNYAGRAIGWIVKNQKPLIKIGSSLFRIIGAIGSGVWKEFSSILTGITGGSRKSGEGLNNMATSLSKLASHTKQLQKFGRVLANLWLISKMQRFNKNLLTVFHTLTKFKAIKSIQTRLRRLNANWQHNTGILNRASTRMKRLAGAANQTTRPIRTLTVYGFKRLGQSARRFGRLAQLGFLKARRSENNYSRSLRQATMGQRVMRLGLLPLKMGFRGVSLATRGFGLALRSIPIVGWIQIAIDGLTEIYMHSAKFRRLVNPMLRFIGKAIGWIGDKIADSIGGIIKFAKNVGHVTSKVLGFFHLTKSHASSTSSSMNRYTRNSSAAYRKSQSSNVSATKRAHKSIDRYRHNSSGKFRAYISKNGKIYRKYHKGTTRISETTYKQREALRSRYYRRYASQLKKYEANYKKYENKRSSLSRKYGKLRAMYSVKSLRLIEKRFKRLRNTIVRYSKRMFTDTQHWFKRLGTGAGQQFKGIYKSVRKYLRMSNREAVRQFRALYKNSRRWLNGSINKYVKALRYRSRKQKFYDKQLVKQAKNTGKAMYKLPLGWISRETKDLIKNWKRQRHSFIAHNERMTHAERTHLTTMTDHMKSFRNHFESLMSDMEDSIYHSWSKFWERMHSRTGSGMNSVQRPLNTGAEHINSFVRAFGETTSPMHEMPEVSYSTGTGALNNIRRPITQMTDAVLNDGSDSPETNNQETIIKPNGKVEFPHGQNIHEMLEPGTEVLNATETKLMSQMTHFAPTVHLATGTGIFGNIFNHMSSWLRNAISGSNSGTDYSSIWTSTKGRGKNHLLKVLEKILKNYQGVIAGFMGNAPTGYHGALNDITKGIYGQTSNQVDKWWQVLMHLTDQALNNGASSSQILNYAEKHWMGVPYVYGATSNRGADCGGAVQSILRHFGINISHTDMEDSPAVHFVGKSFSDARPGDLVMFGSHSGSKAGASSHVGIYSGHGQMWNECPPRSTISSVKDAADADGLWGFYRLKGAPQSNNSLSRIKVGSQLGNFVKHQESPMLKWIEKNLAPLLDPNPGGGPGVAKWRSVIEQAAEHMHVHLTDEGLHKIMSNIAHESNGDEDVTQHISDINSAEGHPAQGLLQFIPSTFAHYAVAGHNNIKSGYDQLLALFNDSSWFSDIAPGGGWGPSGSRKYARGGHINAGQLAAVHEHGYELFRPDEPGKIIPHNESKRILNRNNNSHPVKVEQHNTFNITGGSSKTVTHNIDKKLDEDNDNLADKLAHLFGFDEGGEII